jgi:hypothetical protein
LETADQRTAERAALSLVEEARRLVDLAPKSLVEGLEWDCPGNDRSYGSDAHRPAYEKMKPCERGYNKSSGTFVLDGHGMTDDHLQI